ncbi:hypothetical protein HDU77_002360 [Chytriomyces hyalinus]|nr:hypothetical protein HDU77_002360 [Chytriomyces hyalinus]
MNTPSPRHAVPNASNADSPSCSEYCLELERPSSESTSKRAADYEKKEMNRLAQREFRKRKAQKFKELQAKVSELTTSNVCGNCLSNQTRMLEAMDRAKKLEHVVSELLKQNGLLKSMVHEYRFSQALNLPFLEDIKLTPQQNVTGDFEPSSISLFDTLLVGSASGRMPAATGTTFDSFGFGLLADFAPFENNLDRVDMH